MYRSPLSWSIKPTPPGSRIRTAPSPHQTIHPPRGILQIARWHYSRGATSKRRRLSDRRKEFRGSGEDPTGTPTPRCCHKKNLGQQSQAVKLRREFRRENEAI